MRARKRRATIYLEPELHKALRLMSAERSQSISKVVNDAVREALGEDAEDLIAFEERRNKSVLSFDEFAKKLKRRGRAYRSKR